VLPAARGFSRAEGGGPPKHDERFIGATQQPRREKEEDYGRVDQNFWGIGIEQAAGFWFSKASGTSISAFHLTSHTSFQFRGCARAYFCSNCL
jgi:hypothetical protein